MGFSVEKEQLLKLNKLCKSRTEKTQVLLPELGIKNPANTLRNFESMVINVEKQQAPVFTFFEINEDTFTYSLSSLFCQLAQNSDKWVIDDFIKSPTGEPTQIYVIEQQPDQQNTKKNTLVISAIATFLFIVISCVAFVSVDTKNSVTPDEFIHTNISDITAINETIVDEINKNESGEYIVSVSFLDSENMVNEKYKLKLGNIETETDHTFTILYSTKIID